LVGFEIPKEYPKESLKNHYICIGIKSKDSADGMQKVHSARMLGAGLNFWHKMQRQVKAGTFKSMFAGIYDKIVILHNPTLPMAKEEPKEKKVKGLSPKHKSKVKEMLEAGEEVATIAEELSVSIERIEAYLNK
jgi:DNA-binding NarL/FixJ family response regulator